MPRALILAPQRRSMVSSRPITTGVEHHLLRLAGIGADKHHAAVAETDVRGLHDRRHRICRKFRVRAITMEKKETSYGETEATGYFRRAA